MNTISKSSFAFFLCLFLSMNAAYAEITTKDYSSVIKTTKKLAELSNKKNIEELSTYYSDNYKGFDGCDKKSAMLVYAVAQKLYPNLKTKETITKVETQNDEIKVFIEEKAFSKMVLKKQDPKYSIKETVKGKMSSNSSYAMVWAKENGEWKVIKDEIFDETTKIEYGEALNAGFQMDTPKNITPGEEFCVKTTLKMPENRAVMGSIGHDKIVFPPEKQIAPHRTVDRTGILERIMIANKEGVNEYVSSTMTFIAPVENAKTSPNLAISGMGIYYKRINSIKNDKAL